MRARDNSASQLTLENLKVPTYEKITADIKKKIGTPFSPIFLLLICSPTTLYPPHLSYLQATKLSLNSNLALTCNLLE